MYTFLHLIWYCSCYSLICNTPVMRVAGLLSINMTNVHALRTNLLNYTQYLTISPCFRRHCCSFYTSYLPSLQILRTMQNVFTILNNFKHQTDKCSHASRALTGLFSIFDDLTLFSVRFARIWSFIHFRLTVIAHFTARFVRISSKCLHLNCKMYVFPLIQFRIDVPDERWA